MDIIRRKFGITKFDKEVYEYTLVNNRRFMVKILNYGGVIREISHVDNNGKRVNLVLGYDNILDYEEKSPYFGCIIGRTAGRISKGRFTIDGHEYRIPINNNGNNLHGGNEGFHKVIWDVNEIREEKYVSVELQYLSPHMEEGYPGNLMVKVKYTLNEENELRIDYNGFSDKKTIIDLTNHSYFNLSGGVQKDVLDHYLYINASKYICVDDDIIPNGNIVDVDNSPFDFTECKKIGDNLDYDNLQIKNCGGYDHPFVLEESAGYNIKLYHKESSKALEITTDRPCVVFYSGNSLDEVGIKKHGALCLETQGYPDAINQPNFLSKTFDVGELYTTYTKYKFIV